MIRNSKPWFFALIGALNLAVGVMFYVVTIPAPIPVVADTVSIAQPVRPNMIPATTGVPNRITIPTLDIDLRIRVGSYSQSDGTWTIDAVNAFYADPSLPANNSNGKTLIYGHAQSQVFGRIPDIQNGAEAQVFTDNGYVFRYTYDSMVAVVPTDTTIFSADGPPTLVLQTCTGDWDAFRALYSYTFKSVAKI